MHKHGTLKQLKPKFAAWLRKAPANVFGNSCFLCGDDSHSLLCQPCADELPETNKEACSQCALPLPSRSLCPECINTPPAFRKTVCAFNYVYPLSFMMNEFKHRHHLKCGRFMSASLATKLKQEYGNEHFPSLVIPMALNKYRRWLRGFNQAHYIASHLSSELSIPLHQSLQRSKSSTRQQSLKRHQRLKNVTGSLVICPEAETRLQGKSVALVDDVVTTGATAQAASRLLLNHGALHVDIWALALTPKQTA